MKLYQTITHVKIVLEKVEVEVSAQRKIEE